MATVSEASVTIIGESVQVRGNLSGDEDLHVLGRIEGSIELERTLVVAQSGVVKAEVSVRNAVVSGVVVGNIHASESVEITKEGRMVGDISSPRVIIVDGASFRGNVDMGDVENMPARPPRRERPVTAPLPKAQKRDDKKPAAEKPAAAEKAAESAASSKASEPAASKPTPAEKPAEKAPEPAEAKSSPAAPSRSPVAARSSSGKAPGFLNPPKAKGLPKKNKKSRVVVKRR